MKIKLCECGNQRENGAKTCSECQRLDEARRQLTKEAALREQRERR